MDCIALASFAHAHDFSDVSPSGGSMSEPRLVWNHLVWVHCPEGLWAVSTRSQAVSFTNIHLYFDDIDVGQEWESLGRTVTEADIINFAGVSGDFNPIHMDHEFARSTMFRQPIAHGLLVFSMASGLGSFAPPMRTLAFMAIRDWS